jgi:hypothetical protein
MKESTIVIKPGQFIFCPVVSCRTKQLYVPEREEAYKATCTRCGLKFNVLVSVKAIG